MISTEKSEQLFKTAVTLSHMADSEPDKFRRSGLKGHANRLLNLSVIGKWAEVVDGFRRDGHTPRRTVELEDGDMSMELECAKEYARVK